MLTDNMALLDEKGKEALAKNLNIVK